MIGSKSVQVRLRGSRSGNLRREESMGGTRRRRGQGSVQRARSGRRDAIGRVHRRSGKRFQRGGQPVRQRKHGLQEAQQRRVRFLISSAIPRGVRSE